MGIWLGKQLLGQCDSRPGLGGPQVVISLGHGIGILPPDNPRHALADVAACMPQIADADVDD
jgi:hypothetical protein